MNTIQFRLFKPDTNKKAEKSCLNPQKKAADEFISCKNLQAAQMNRYRR
jgi:hypothetical protein